jgi:hypothetical protein
MIDVIIFCALIICFATIVAGAAEYILDRGAEDEKDRLIDEIIKDLERRNDNEH